MNISQRRTLKLWLNLKTQCPLKPWWTESMSSDRRKHPPAGLMSIGDALLLPPFTEDKSRVKMEKDSPDRHKGNRPTQTSWRTHTASARSLRLFSYAERVGAAEKLLVELVYDEDCNGLFQENILQQVQVNQYVESRGVNLWYLLNMLMFWSLTGLLVNS